MRSYTNKITLSENRRGIFSLDTIMGCKSGIEKNKQGCYGDCYAARSARIYGYNFSEIVLRDFESEKHLKLIKRKINKQNVPFIRIGSSGDPSEDWEHTIKILELLSDCDKPVVIITKHWNKLNINQLKRIKKLDLCINTSISAIDKNLHERIEQYEILKKYCNSILRVVSFDFNTTSKKGLEFSLLQNWIFNTYDVLDNIFRCSKSNYLHKSGIIKVKETKFLGDKCYVSKFNETTHFGLCKDCSVQCGLNL